MSDEPVGVIRRSTLRPFFREEDLARCDLPHGAYMPWLRAALFGRLFENVARLDPTRHNECFGLPCDYAPMRTVMGVQVARSDVRGLSFKSLFQRVSRRVSLCPGKNFILRLVLRELHPHAQRAPLFCPVSNVGLGLRILMTLNVRGESGHRRPRLE